MSKTVLTAAERITEKFGGKWQKVGSEILKPPPAISTGSLLLDEALGCQGFPEGSIIEAFGPQHSGKTLMGYICIAGAQKKYPNRDNLLLDAENQFRYQARWAQQVGVDVPKLFVSPVTSAEECFDKIEMAILGDVEFNKEGKIKRVVKPGNFAVIMIDSVTQLTPLEMVHKSMDENTRLASLASVMSHGLKKIVSAMSLTQSRTILFFINQTRTNPGQMFGSKEVRTGGNSLPFYDTIAFRVSKIKKSEERDARGKIFAHQVKIKFEKNKAGQLPANPIIFKLKYDGSGIDNNFELFTVAEINKLIEKFGRKLNFVKPGTKDKLDPAIADFKQEDFPTVLQANPKIKEMILKYIKEGCFYVSETAVEEEDDSEESSKKKETKAEETHQEEEPILPPEETLSSPAGTANTEPVDSATEAPVETPPESPVDESVVAQPEQEVRVKRKYTRRKKEE